MAEEKKVEEQSGGEQTAEKAAEGAVEVKFEKWLTEGWNLYRSEMVEMIILALIFIGAMAILKFTLIGPALLYGPLLCGIYYVIFQKMRGNKMNIGDIAKGLSVFLPALLASLVISIFTSIGFMLLIIPGFFVTAAYMFTFPLIMDRGMDFWDAMETSRKKVMEKFVAFTLFVFLVAVVGVSGVILLGFGIILTLPFALCTLAVAYRDVFGLSEEPQE